MAILLPLIFRARLLKLVNTRVQQTDNQICIGIAFNSFAGCKQYCVLLRRLDVGEYVLDQINNINEHHYLVIC